MAPLANLQGWRGRGVLKKHEIARFDANFCEFLFRLKMLGKCQAKHYRNRRERVKMKMANLKQWMIETLED